jgi:hypothetical protein
MTTGACGPTRDLWEESEDFGSRVLPVARKIEESERHSVPEPSPTSLSRQVR